MLSFIKRSRWIVLSVSILCNCLNILMATTPSYPLKESNTQQVITQKVFQDTLIHTHLYFGHDREQIDSAYRHNLRSMDSIRVAFDILRRDSLQSISTIIIEGCLQTPAPNTLLTTYVLQTANYPSRKKVGTMSTSG